MIQMGIGKSLEKSWRASPMKVYGAHEGSNRIEGETVRGSRRVEEGVRNVFRDQDPLDAEINPRGKQIMEENIPLLLVFVEVGFKLKTVDPINL